MLRALLLASLLGFMAGCGGPATASAPPTAAPSGARSTAAGSIPDFAGSGSATEVNASPDVVWPVLAQVYRSMGVDAKVRDERALTLGTQRFTGTRVGDRRVSELVRCGNQGAGPSAMSQQRIQLAIVSKLESTPNGGTRVVTEVVGAANTAGGASRAAVRCASTGQIEQAIVERIRELVATGGA